MKNNKQRLIIILKVALSLILLGVFIMLADLKKIMLAFSSFQGVWIWISFFFIALSMLISAWKWGVLLNVENQGFKLIELFRIYVTALFFNNFLPSSIGGDGVRIFLAGRKSGKPAAAAATVVMERVLATVSLSLLGLLGAVFALNVSRIVVWVLVGILVVSSVLTFGLLTGWVPKAMYKSEKKIIRGVVAFIQSAGALRSYPKEIIKCFLLSFAFQIAVALVVWSIMSGMGLSLPGLGDLFFVTSATSVMSMVPLSINGYGMREGAYIFLLNPYNITTASALTISVLFAVFVSLFSLLGGLFWTMEKKDNGGLLKSEDQGMESLEEV